MPRRKRYSEEYANEISIMSTNILKQLDDDGKIDPTEIDTDSELFAQSIEELSDNGYITGIDPSRMRPGYVTEAMIDDIKMSDDGAEYLEQQLIIRD